MMAELYNDAEEKLYLLKNGRIEISVPCKDLAQHQIDGVRFLFNQFRLKKPGVIMNYPPGCGTAVQVAVFLQAVHMHLEKPVLLLYKTENEKNEWLERFKKWTTIDSDQIVVNSSPDTFVKNWNSSVKKLIHLNDIGNMNCFGFWSIVIIKSDEINQNVLKSKLNTHFKIWITSIQMSKNEICSIYSWMYSNNSKHAPEIKRIVDDNTKESYVECLLVDLLLKDMLSSRRDLESFWASKRQHETENDIPKVTRKNKDATGLKIKRSKKNVENPSTSAVTKNETSISDIHNSIESNKKVDINEEPKLDVESFIRDNEPLESDCHLNMAIKNLDDALLDTENNFKIEDLDIIDNSVTIAAQNGTANNDNDMSTKQSQDSRFSIELIDDDFSQNSKDYCTESNEVFSSTMPVIENVFTISKEENNKAEFQKKDGSEDSGQVSSDENVDVVGDQEKKVEITTIRVTQETDDSFDSKIKRMEEQALKKFKGSFLDNIF